MATRPPRSSGSSDTPVLPSGELGEYDRKRDFTVTSEPGPEAPALPSASPRFMVHKHHARRLHYDLRLEIDGKLASWAVPRGPSYDPATKRLAVQTEDHPLAYGDFEGRIPDGQYGAGDSLVWDRGLFDTVPPGQAAAQRRKGHLHIALAGEKLRGEWHLLRTTTASGRRAAQGDFTASGPKSQWLMMKLDDEEANPALDIVVAHPESVLTGRIETRGPVAQGKGGAAAKPSMPTLLKSGVLGSEHEEGTEPYESTQRRASEKRIPTPLFARVPLAELNLDVSRPQDILELPAHLFDEPSQLDVEAQAVGGAAPQSSMTTQPSRAPSAELFFRLDHPSRSALARDTRLGAVADVALVLRDLFAGLGLHALACIAGPAALLVRVPIAPAPALGALERFAERIAHTLAAQLPQIRDGEVQLDISLNRPGARAPELLSPLPDVPKLICAPIAWDALTPDLSPASFSPRWLVQHEPAVLAQVAAHLANAARLPRAR